ncbi:hypothetical protein BH11PSE3_BH11PSE3_36020 [soil metagenome]
MAGSFHRCGSTAALTRIVLTAAGALMLAACGSTSYTQAAMTASDAGDQKTAATLAKKEVARFARPSECSATTTTNCGTLALAYGTLAGYQIMDGDRTSGEGSFRSARAALSQTDPANRSSATAMVYRDVSEAYWKMGDRGRAIDVFNQGRVAGADKYLFMSSAARAAEPPPPQPATDQPGTDQPGTDQPATELTPQDQPPKDQPPQDQKARGQKAKDQKATNQKVTVSR